MDGHRDQYTADCGVMLARTVGLASYIGDAIVQPSN